MILLIISTRTFIDNSVTFISIQIDTFRIFHGLISIEHAIGVRFIRRKDFVIAFFAKYRYRFCILPIIIWRNFHSDAVVMVTTTYKSYVIEKKKNCRE